VAAQKASSDVDETGVIVGQNNAQSRHTLRKHGAAFTATDDRHIVLEIAPDLARSMMKWRDPDDDRD
jgi:hypothetical protein